MRSYLLLLIIAALSIQVTGCSIQAKRGKDGAPGKDGKSKSKPHVIESDHLEQDNKDTIEQFNSSFWASVDESKAPLLVFKKQ